MHATTIPTSQIYYIDSDRRITGTHSNFTHSVALPAHNEFNSCCVLQAKIPKSYWSIPTGKSHFTVTETDATPHTYTVTLDPGNYTRRGLATQLSAKLTAASAAHGLSLVYVTTVPNTSTTADTGKFTITCTTAVATAISFTMSEWLSPAQQLGFDTGATVDFTFAGGVATLTSTNVCNLQSLDSVFIRSDIAFNGNGSMLGEGSILQEVFSNSPDFSSLIFQVGAAGGVDACRKQLRSNHINSASFILTDEHGVELDMNGQSTVISLLCWKA